MQVRGSVATRTLRGVLMTSTLDELIEEITTLGAVEVLDYYNPGAFPKRDELKKWRQSQIKRCIRLIKALEY